MRGPPGELAAVAHDLRSALSAGVAFLDLAQERLREGGLESADLDRVGQALERLGAAVERVQRVADAQREASA